MSLSVEAHEQSMHHSGERAVAGVTSGILGPDDVVTWRARHFGIRFRLTSKITAHEPPHRFIDEQVRGPFRIWWHEHLFEESEGSVLMRDNLYFESPAGVLGRVVNAVVLTGYMTRLMESRNRHLARMLQS